MEKITLLILLLVMIACATKEQGDTLVLFSEKERGIESYQTRMIITKNYLRIDDGQGSDDFVLFDRSKRVIYSTNPGERRIMEVHEKRMKNNLGVSINFQPPFKLIHTVREMPEMNDAPEISGEKAKHYQLITNNETCYDVVAVKKLLPEVVKALTEFHTMMATDSAFTFNNIPADLRNACDMSMTTFAPTRYLQFGFPIREWGKDDYVRSLVDFQTDYKANPELFILPAGYKLYKVEDLRAGKVSFDD